MDLAHTSRIDPNINVLIRIDPNARITTVKEKMEPLEIYTEDMSDPAIRKLLRDVEILTAPTEERLVA